MSLYFIKKTCSAALVILSSLMIFACTTTPKIPDQSDIKTYRSTKEEEQVENKKLAATDPLASAKDADTIPRAKGPVAIVNGEPITAKDYNAELDKLLATRRIPKEAVPRLKEMIVQSLVTKRLLQQEIKKENFVISDKKVDDKLAQTRAEFDAFSKANPGQAASFEQMLKNMGINTQDLRGSLREAIAIEQLVVKHGHVQPTDAEVRAVYDQNPSKFTQPEQTRASHILVRVQDTDDQKAWQAAKTKIEKIHKEASAKNAQFSDLAKKYSDDPSKQRGGDLGFFPKKVMVPNFEKVAFTLKKGELSTPLKTRFGWHIILKTDHKAQGLRPFEELKEALKKQLNQQKFQSSLMKYIQVLRKQSTISLSLQNIS